jgi:arginase family enzyme
MEGPVNAVSPHPVTAAEPAIVAMLCRTSERTGGGAPAAAALARELAARHGTQARLIGTAGEARAAGWREDLRRSRGCLLEAGGQVDDALAAGAYPVLIAADCSVSMTTLPTVLRHRPDAMVLWLDAHGDFNTPETTPSDHLGGMCLSAACGLWDAGFGGPALSPARVVMCGVRDVDGRERVLLETKGVARVARPSLLADVLRDREVFVHLDLDVLDPSVLPGAQFPAPGGLSDGGLRLLLEEVAGACTLLGCEVTAFGAPELAELVASIVEPLVP